MSVYNTIKEEIEKGSYTITEAEETIGNLYTRKNITAEQYNDLMDLASKLEVNSSTDQEQILYVSLEKRVSNIESDINSIKEKLMEEGIEIPGEDNPDGSQENPIEAYRGMIYYQNKYYKDPEDNNTYLCTRDRDDKPGEGIALNYLPHELIGHYFQLM